MPASHYVKVFGAWRAAHEDPLPSHYTKVFGTWRAGHITPTAQKYIKVFGQWRDISGGGGLPAGTYYLSPSSQSLGVGSGFSEYNTIEYRGRITEIRARVSWRTQSFCIAGLVFGVSGRPNGNFYRNITSDGTWCGRTIDHRIDTFDATSLTDFNSGAAIGFSYSASGLDIGNAWSNVQLGLTIV